ALAGEPIERVWTALEELVSHFFLVPSNVPNRYDFRHSLIQEAIYQQLSIPERSRLHSRVVDLMAARRDVPESVLSHHYERAGRRDEAYQTALASARIAAAISSHREAFELFRRALRNLPSDLPQRDQARTLSEFAAEAAAIDDNITASAAFLDARGRYL